MAKTRTTLTLDEETLKAVKIRAARTGKGESEVMEEAIRTALGVGLLEKIWAEMPVITEEEAMESALQAQAAYRTERKNKKA